MALYQVNAGDRILAADVNQFYAILKGVAASGEAVTLVYNAAASLVLQPSSDPAAGTEVIQIKNNAGTVQGSLTYDGKVKVADGTAALPSLRMQSEASGFYLSAAGIIGVSVSGAASNILMRSGAISIGTTVAAIGALRTANTGGGWFTRNVGNTNDLGLYWDASNTLNVTQDAGSSTIATLTAAALTLGGTAAGSKLVVSGTLTAGGLLTSALQVAISGPLIYSGSGVPSISAAVKGSLYLRSDGSSGTTRAYIATDTAGTWTAINTVA